MWSPKNHEIIDRVPKMSRRVAAIDHQLVSFNVFLDPSSPSPYGSPICFHGIKVGIHMITFFIVIFAAARKLHIIFAIQVKTSHVYAMGIDHVPPSGLSMGPPVGCVEH